MIREKMLSTGFAKETGFRWRGDSDVSRIEGFSDNVFGFALTLLVVSLEVPKTFGDLEEVLRGFLGFAFAFSLLFLFWYEHYRYFRRYGLEGNTVLWLNALLLFVILFFVYPLKFLITFLSRVFSGSDINVTLSDGSIVPMIQNDQMVTLMLVYGLGYFVISGVFTLLYLHAFRKRNLLELNHAETLITRAGIIAHGANCIIALISITFVIAGGPGYAGFSGLTYCLIGPVQATLGYLNGKKVYKLTHQS